MGKNSKKEIMNNYKIQVNRAELIRKLKYCSPKIIFNSTTKLTRNYSLEKIINYAQNHMKIKKHPEDLYPI